MDTKRYRGGYREIQGWIQGDTGVDTRGYRSRYREIQGWIQGDTGVDTEEYRGRYRGDASATGVCYNN